MRLVEFKLRFQNKPVYINPEQVVSVEEYTDMDMTRPVPLKGSVIYTTSKTAGTNIVVERVRQVKKMLESPVPPDVEVVETEPTVQTPQPDYSNNAQAVEDYPVPNDFPDIASPIPESPVYYEKEKKEPKKPKAEAYFDTSGDIPVEIVPDDIPKKFPKKKGW